MKQEVTRIVTGELSWGQVHKVLVLYPIWAFEGSGGYWGRTGIIRIVA